MTATASVRRQALADLALSRKGEHASGGRWRTVLLALVMIALLGLVGLWLAGYFSTPAEVVALREAVDAQVAELERMARGEIPYSEQQASFGPLFEAARQVPEQYRDQEIGRFFLAREAAEINSYFAVPPAQRAAELDRRIKEEEARRARWEAERAQREASRANADGQNSGASANARSDGGGRRRSSGTEESRNAWVKRYIDRTSPDGRARRTEYRRAKDQRRVAMGLEPSRR